jgi:hypothetical protein
MFEKEDRNDLARWRLGPACYRRENAPCRIMNRGKWRDSEENLMWERERVLEFLASP